MSIIKKLKSSFHDDWCKNCYEEMEMQNKKLFMLPILVGHYVSHTNPDYYKKNLTPVNKKEDIPTGFYACGITNYWCPKCSYKITKLSIFLPVRGIEKYEDTLIFKNGELDELLKNK